MALGFRKVVRSSLVPTTRSADLALSLGFEKERVQNLWPWGLGFRIYGFRV